VPGHVVGAEAADESRNPGAAMVERAISGVLVQKPPSPPPPRRWTCRSTNPGSTSLSRAEITWTSKSPLSLICSAMRAMIRPTTRMSRVPLGSGA